MKTLLLQSDYRKDAARLRSDFPDPSHVDQTIDQDTFVLAPNGNLIVVLLRRRIVPELWEPAHQMWRDINGLISNRPSAVGTKSLPRSVNGDGIPSPQSGVNTTVLDRRNARQGILGCAGDPLRKTQLTIKHPEMLSETKPLIKHINTLYREYAPELYAIQRANVKEGPLWRLWHTAFTTIYIAKNFRTAYHTDRGNLQGVMTAIMPMGHFTGGELVLPRWRIAFAYKPGDLLLFDPQQVHGNLPFKGERLSAAFYCARHTTS
jgi:hypothetical protein